MPLLSQLFKGDSALEDAANRDAAHIVRGAHGPHVEKIQKALNILDDAGLEVDGAYGPATANAVRQFKSKRNIINRSYQDAADDIVGKMTMAKLEKRCLRMKAFRRPRSNSYRSRRERITRKPILDSSLRRRKANPSYL